MTIEQKVEQAVQEIIVKNHMHCPTDYEEAVIRQAVLAGVNIGLEKAGEVIRS